MTMKSSVVTSKFLTVLHNLTLEPIGREYSPPVKNIEDESRVVVDNELFHIEELPAMIESDISVRTLRETPTFTPDDMSKLPHDMVLSYFVNVEKKDISFGDHFGKLNQREYDVPSPDMLINIRGKTMSLEVGTSQRTKDLDALYQSKYNKYDELLRFRDPNSILLILVVSRDKVITNIPMSSEMAAVLILRYRYGLKMRQLAYDLGLSKNLTDEVMRNLDLVERGISSTELYSKDDFLHMTEKTFKEWEEIEHDDSAYHEQWTTQAKKIMDEKVFNKSNKHVEYLSKYLEKVKDPKNRMTDKKPVNTPLFSLPKGAFNNFYHIMNDDSTNETKMLVSFWNQLSNLMFETTETTYEELEDNIKTVEEEVVEREKDIKSKRMLVKNRFKVTLEADDVITMAMSGVNAKRYRQDYMIADKREKNKTPLHWDCKTNDIQRFVESWKEMFSYTDYENPIYERLGGIRDYSETMKSHGFDYYKSMRKTRLLQSLTTFSSIVSEINLSVRKPTKPNEWFVVDHNIYPVRIAIKTTGTHMFYCLLMEKKDVDVIEGPFTNLISLSDTHLSTPVMSMNKHDVSHWLGLPSKFMTMISCFHDIWHVEADLMNHTEPENSQEILASLLVLLENREQTSSSLQNVRYMYMEMLKPKFVDSQPYKVLTKFPTRIRSRLLLWFMKRIILSFNKMRNEKNSRRKMKKDELEEDEEKSDMHEEFAENENDDEDVSESKDKIPHLYSIISLKPLKSFECALNLSYLGVFHNADKGEEIHGYLKIFSKVIKEEINMRDGRFRKEYSGTFKPKETNWDEILLSDMRSHEFSLTHCQRIGRRLLQHFRSKNITDSEMKDEIKKALLSVTFESLATFKASANSSSFKMDDDLDYSTYEKKKRNKALTEIIEIIDELANNDSTPYTRMSELFEMLFRKGGIIANLFKKNQLTGVREIFVLTMISRVVIKILETVSRKLCDWCDNEYLTKGSEKSGATAAHYRKVNQARTSNQSTMSVSDSADATTWCQRFIMAIFGSVFGEIFKGWPKMRDLVCSILNLVTDKRLELPKDLLDLFMKHPEIRSPDDDFINELKDQFFGKSNFTDLLYPMKVLMRNRSNFMQGILHYTSSLIHAGHMMLVKDRIDILFKAKFRDYLTEMSLITTTKVSSDDSSRISTIIYNKDTLPEEVILDLKYFLVLSSSILEASYPLFGAKMSEEKSTTMLLNNIEEFNSVWSVVNTVLTPKIKWAFSSQTYKVSSSVAEKQNIDHNLINDLISNGCKRTTASVAEFCCLLNHYDCTGLNTTTTTIWNRLIDNIVKVMTPMCWFYFLSHHIIGTSLGLNHTKWYNLTIHHSARQSETKARKELIGEADEHGSFNFHTTLPVGFAINYRNFLRENNISTNEEIEARISGNEEILFRKTRSKEESRIMIEVKARSQGIEKAFSFADSSKQHSLAAYISVKPCITLRSTEGRLKGTLPAIIKKFMVSDLEGPDTISSWFPQADFYERITHSLDLLKPIIDRKRRRKFLLKLHVPKMANVAQVKLLDVIRKKWFDLEVREPKYLVDISFKKYKSELIWLKDTFKESLEEFRNVMGDTTLISFSDYIKNYDEKSSTIVFMHSGRVKSGIDSVIIDCLSRNYSVNRRLFDIGHDMRKYLSSKVSSVSEDMNRMESDLVKLKSFANTPVKLRYIKSVLDPTHHLPLENITDTLLSHIRRHHLPLFLISMLNYHVKMNRRLSSETRDSVIDLMIRANCGVLSFYKQMQTKQADGTWKGDAILESLINGVSVRLWIRDGELTFIRTNSIKKLKTCRPELESLLKSLNCRTRERFLKYEEGLVFFDGRLTFTQGTHHCPIIEDKFTFDMDRELSVSVELNKADNPILRFNIDGFSGDSIVFNPRKHLEYEVKTPHMINSLRDKPLECWINSRRLEGDNMRTFFNSMDKVPNLYDWSLDSIRSRLIYREKLHGMLPEKYLYEEESEETGNTDSVRSERDVMEDIKNEIIKDNMYNIEEAGVENEKLNIFGMVFTEEDQSDIFGLMGFGSEYSSDSEEEDTSMMENTDPQVRAEDIDKLLAAQNFISADLAEYEDDTSVFEVKDLFSVRLSPFSCTNVFWDYWIAGIEMAIGDLSSNRSREIDFRTLRSEFSRSILNDLGFKQRKEDMNSQFF